MKIRLAFVILLIGVSSWAQERFEPMGSLYNFQNHPSYVQINGDFVYAGGPSSGMSVVDISDRANPLFTEYFDVVGTECVLADSLLFVLGEYEIHIFDVSNPAIPQFVSMIGSYHNNGFSYDNNIAVILSSGRVSEGQYEGFYVYNFRIFDLADVANPQAFFLETIYLDGGLSPWGYHPVIVNQILYLWDRRDAALGRYDLSDPSQPIELEDFENNLSPITTNSAGDVLYASQYTEENQRQFSTIDISNPDNLQMISQIDSLTGYEIEYSDTLLIIGNGDSPNVTVLNAADPEEIVIWSQFETQTSNLLISGQNDACATISNSGLIEVIDLSDPESVDVGQPFHNKGNLREIDFAGNVGYAASSQDGIRIIDVSDPEDMSEIGLWSNGASIHNLSVENDILYAFGINPIFYILDVSDPANPQELSQFRVDNRILQCHAEDGYIFLFLRDEGISIIDATDPREPTEVSTIDGQLSSFRVYQDDLFINERENGFYRYDRQILHHFNIQNRSMPQLLASTIIYEYGNDYSSEITSFHVEQNIVYFVLHWDCIWHRDPGEGSDFVIVDIDDSDNPHVISETHISGYGFASEYRHTLEDFQNHIAFISSNGVLKVYSTWNREWPRHVATFSGVNRFESMSILNNYIFVSDYNELLSFDSAGLLSAPYAPPPPLPTAISLSAYPNPFNASVTVSFDLPRSMPVSLQVFDLSGRLVETLVENTEYSGKQSIVWNTRDIVSGVYMLRLETTEGNTKFQRVTLVK